MNCFEVFLIPHQWRRKVPKRGWGTDIEDITFVSMTSECLDYHISRASKLPGDIRFGFEIRGKSYDKYYPCYVVRHLCTFGKEPI